MPSKSAPTPTASHPARRPQPKTPSCERTRCSQNPRTEDPGRRPDPTPIQRSAGFVQDCPLRRDAPEGTFLERLPPWRPVQPFTGLRPRLGQVGLTQLSTEIYALEASLVDAGGPVTHDLYLSPWTGWSTSTQRRPMQVCIWATLAKRAQGGQLTRRPSLAQVSRQPVRSGVVVHPEDLRGAKEY